MGTVDDGHEPSNDAEGSGADKIEFEEEEEQAEEIECALSDDELEELAEEAQYYITGCASSQPYDEGEVVWIDQHETINDVLDRIGVPEKCKDDVADLISCPCCRDHHELFDEVTVKSDGEIRYEHLMEEWYAKHADRLDDFYSYLSRYPYLGGTHELGIEIRKSLQKFPLITVDGQQWFRARRIKSGKPMSASEFRPPDPAEVPIPEGRYNHHGQSAFYLSNDREGAAIECVDEGETRAWVQQFKLGRIENILNLTLEENWADDDLHVLALGLMHSGALDRTVQRSMGWKPEYFVPRYIADCAREAGFNGILFKSARHWRDNLVLFAYDQGRIEPEGSPEIVEIKRTSSADRKFIAPSEEAHQAELIQDFFGESPATGTPANQSPCGVSDSDLADASRP